MLLFVRSNAMQVGVAKNAEQPGLGALRVTELHEIRLSLAKGILRKVFRVRSRARKPVGIAVQRHIMVGDQLFDYLPFAGQTHGQSPFSCIHEP